MRLFRFCSKAEVDALIAGETLRNDTDHYNGGKGGSTSVGFCFTPELPREAWSFLKGTVTPEVCVEYRIPEKRLRRSRGKYAGRTVWRSATSCVVEPLYKTEYCTTVLSLEWAHLVKVIPLEKFVPDYEIAGAKIAAEYKKRMQKDKTI